MLQQVLPQHELYLMLIFEDFSTEGANQWKGDLNELEGVPLRAIDDCLVLNVA